MLTKRGILIPFIAIVAMIAFAASAGANLSTGTKAPNFSAPTFGGKNFTLANTVKSPNKVTVLEFISVYCPHCQAAAPHMQALSKKYAGKGVSVVSVVLNPGRSEVDDFVKTYKITYPVVLDPDAKKTGDLYQLEGVPSIYIIDSRGTIRYTHFGYPMDNDGQKKTSAQIDKEVKTLLSKS